MSSAFHAPAPALTVRLYSWGDAKPFAQPIRERVFITEQGVPGALEWDEWDDTAEHAIAFSLGGLAIGTGRLLPDGRIGRMAVLREWRRRGTGAELLRVLVEHARAMGLAVVNLHAQVHARGFYRRFGFLEYGAVFEEAGIPHVEMRLRLRSVRS